MRLVVDLPPPTLTRALDGLRILLETRGDELPDEQREAAAEYLEAAEDTHYHHGDDQLDALGRPADGGDRVTYESDDPAVRAAIARIASGRSWREGPPPVRVRVVMDYAPERARPTRPEDLREPRRASGEVMPLRPRSGPGDGGDGGGG